MTARCSKCSPPVTEVSRLPADGDEARDGETTGPGFEPHVDLHVDGRVFRRAPTQSAHDAEAGVIGELDEDDRVRHLEVGHPPLVVDGEAVDATPSGDLDHGGVA